MDNDTLALELLKEVKASAKRWFVCFCIMTALEIATILCFIWYVSLPVEDTTITQETSDTGNNQYIGGDNSGEANN